MNIDLGSFAFGSILNIGAGTPSWGTALGQSKPEYYITREGANELIMGMVYKSVPLADVELPLGKGGRMYTGVEAGTIQLASLFDKVFVNEVPIDYPFIMVLQKEESDSHTGRRGIKYTDKAEYKSGDVYYSNAKFIEKVREKYGLSESACWFVYDISVSNYEELHMKSVFVNKEENMTYENSRGRSEEWIKLIEESGESYSIIEKKMSGDCDLSYQQIFYGAPGTGKSHTIKQEVEDKGRIHFRTTFHPDSDYSTFVGCYKPTMRAVKKTVVIGQDEKEVKPLSDGSDSVEQISYSFVPQAFTKAYCEAWNRLKNNEPVFLIIEEINRGNCAQIFGDLFQLLDRKDDGSSDYPIDADEDLKKFLLNGTKEDGNPWLANKEGIKDGKLSLPRNLYIWATMNTSDQSLFPIDSAFKRRWDWKYMPIDTKKENWTIKVNNNQYSWSSFLDIINEKILAKTQSEDKQLGFYFCKADNNIISAERFVSKVLFYIYNDVYKDFGFDDAFFKNGDEKLSFQGYYKPNGEINEDKVEALLKNLNIKIVTEENDDDIESDSENAGKKEHKETLVSVTLNGETIKSSTQFDTYLDTIKAIGTDKVGAHIESMKFKRYGCPLASTVQMDGIKNSEGEYSYVSAGQYHFVKGAKSYTLIRVLEELKNIMNLDLEIEYK